MSKTFFCAIFFLGLPGGQGWADEIELVMPPTRVAATGDRSVFATPLDYQRGTVVVAQVEDADVQTPAQYLRTVVYLGHREANGRWRWSATTIERRTLHDPYHTQPSIAFDRDGFVHVAYNMHHVPWQYVISAKPYDIEGFIFRGNAVSQGELDTIRLHNKTYFPTAGSAAIPGNQITYPAFFKDRRSDLYVVYRYAMRPARDWPGRDYAIGVAKYNAENRGWRPLGGSIPLNKGDVTGEDPLPRSASPFLFDKRYLPYLVTLAFDTNNGMHAIWTWWSRAGGTDGSSTLMPSYRYLPDPDNAITALSLNESQQIARWVDGTVFNTSKAMAVAGNGDVLAIFEPKGKGRQLIRRSRETGEWSVPVETPHSASKIKVSSDGTEWLFASGLKLFKRRPGEAWSKPIAVGKDLCEPWPVYAEEENAFYIRAKSCADFASAVVYRYGIS